MTMENTWKKLKFKTYVMQDGSECDAPVEEQLKEILHYYIKGYVVICSIGHWNYEHGEILELPNIDLTNENVEEETLSKGIEYLVSIMCNAFYNSVSDDSFYTCMTSPYEKE